MKKVREPNIAINDDYVWPYNKIKTILSVSCILFLAFVLNFPISKIAGHYLNTVLESTPNCRIQFKDYEFGFFLPSVNFNEVIIPRGCMGPNQNSFRFDRLEASFGGLNFSPLGAVTGLSLKLGPQNIDLKASSDGNTHVIKIEKQTVHLSHLTDFLRSSLNINAPLLKGKATLDTDLSLSQKGLELFELGLTSRDLALPSQSISAFVIPDLDLKRLKLDVSGKGNRILLKKLEAGNNGGPLYLNIDGSINANYQNFILSNIDLKTEFNLGPQILELFGPFIGIISPYKTGDSSYKLRLKGNLIAPMPSPL